jgi:hypothetical protein
MCYIFVKFPLVPSGGGGGGGVRGDISHDRLMNVLWKVNLVSAVNCSLSNGF